MTNRFVLKIMHDTCGIFLFFVGICFVFVSIRITINLYNPLFFEKSNEISTLLLVANNPQKPPPETESARASLLVVEDSVSGGGFENC